MLGHRAAHPHRTLNMPLFRMWPMVQSTFVWTLVGIRWSRILGLTQARFSPLGFKLHRSIFRDSSLTLRTAAPFQYSKLPSGLLTTSVRAFHERMVDG